jgi:hypothetical protein
VFHKSQGDVAYSILNYEWKIETCVPDKKVMNCDKGERPEECENSRDIVKRNGVDFLGEI